MTRYVILQSPSSEAERTVNPEPRLRGDRVERIVRLLLGEKLQAFIWLRPQGRQSAFEIAGMDLQLVPIRI